MLMLMRMRMLMLMLILIIIIIIILTHETNCTSDRANSSTNTKSSLKDSC